MHGSDRWGASLRWVQHVGNGFKIGWPRLSLPFLAREIGGREDHLGLVVMRKPEATASGFSFWRTKWPRWCAYDVLLLENAALRMQHEVDVPLAIQVDRLVQVNGFQREGPLLAICGNT